MSYEESKQEQAQRNIQAASATRARQQDRSTKQGGTATRRLPHQYTNQELFRQVLSSSALRNNRDPQQHDVSDLRSSSQTQEYSLFPTDNKDNILEQQLPLGNEGSLLKVRYDHVTQEFNVQTENSLHVI